MVDETHISAAKVGIKLRFEVETSPEVQSSSWRYWTQNEISYRWLYASIITHGGIQRARPAHFVSIWLG